MYIMIFDKESILYVKDFIENYSLDNRFINAKRLEYLEYHRKEVFEKRFKFA